MRRRCKEAGEKPKPITELEKLAVRHCNASSSSATIQSNSAQRERQSKQDGSSSESEDKVYEQVAHSNDKRDERVMVEFETRR